MSDETTEDPSALEAAVRGLVENHGAAAVMQAIPEEYVFNDWPPRRNRPAPGASAIQLTDEAIVTVAVPGHTWVLRGPFHVWPIQHHPTRRDDLFGHVIADYDTETP